MLWRQQPTGNTKKRKILLTWSP